MSKKKYLAVLVGLVTIFNGCKTPDAILKNGLIDNSELKELMVKDQKLRNATIDMEPIDRLHRSLVMSFLANGLVRTARDKFNASLILQHTALTFCDGKLVSISPENYLLAHYLSKSAFDSGYTGSAYMTAATFDRYLLYTQGYQKYGTQRVIEESTGEEVWAPIDINTTDAERKLYNVPSLAELLKKFKMKPSTK